MPTTRRTLTAPPSEPLQRQEERRRTALKPHHYPAALAIATAAVLAAGLYAQSPVVPAYQGMQPELVQGIQDGLATGKPKIRHIYLAAPDTLAIVVHAQSIPRLAVKPYVKEPNDRLILRYPAPIGASGRVVYKYRTIIRNGLEYNSLCSANAAQDWRDRARGRILRR